VKWLTSSVCQQIAFRKGNSAGSCRGVFMSMVAFGSVMGAAGADNKNNSEFMLIARRGNSASEFPDCPCLLKLSVLYISQPSPLVSREALIATLGEMVERELGG
jgi:hypothetical protein